MLVNASILQWFINEEEVDSRQIGVEKALQIRARKVKQEELPFVRKQYKERSKKPQLPQ